MNFERVFLAFLLFCVILTISCDLKSSVLLAFGGGSDKGYSVKQTNDQGFIVTGTNVLAKFFENGTLEWSSSLGGCTGNSVGLTSDGGYVVTGSRSENVYLARFYSNGSLSWATCLGGGSSDCGESVLQTNDGGFIVTGYTKSFGSGEEDVLLAKFYSNGSLEWARTLGYYEYDDDQLCHAEDIGNSIHQTSDGGYIVTGQTQGFKGGTQFNEDILLAKFNFGGVLEWGLSFGGWLEDYGFEGQQTVDGGYIVTGFTESFGPSIYGNVLLAKFDADGGYDWGVAMGGFDEDVGNSVQQTSDGGYIVAGETWSFGEGRTDALLIKIHSNGSQHWASTFQASDDSYDIGYSVEQTLDGGYIVTGSNSDLGIFLSSVNQDGEAILRDDCETGWIAIAPGEFLNVMLSEESSTFWDVSQYSEEDVSSSISTGYISLGESFISLGITFDCNVYRECFGVGTGFDGTGPNVCSGHGDCVNNNDNCECLPDYFGMECNIQDCYGFLANESEVCSGLSNGDCVDIDTCACKNDFFGDECELRQYPSFYTEIDGENYSGRKITVRQTMEGGFIVVGVIDRGPSRDILLSKIHSNGSLEWAIGFGGDNFDYGKSVQQTNDGGYIVTGYSKSFPVPLWSIILTAKFSSNGTLEWACALSGSNLESWGNFVQQTSDSGYIVVGGVRDYGGSTQTDLLISKLSSSGSLEWVKAIIGSSSEEGNCVQQTSPDDGYIVAGYSKSAGAGVEDVLLAKFTSVGDVEWVQTLGGEDCDEGFSVQQTDDGWYIVVGVSRSFYSNDDVFIAKFYFNGVLEYARTFGGIGNDDGRDIQKTTDGGYVIVGTTHESFATGDVECLLIKLFPDGSMEWVSTMVGYDEISDEVGYSIQQTKDGGYMVAGIIVGRKKIFLSKVYRDAEGCEKFLKIADQTAEAAYRSIENIFSENWAGITSTNILGSMVEYIPINSSYHVDVISGEMGVSEYCKNEFSCFGIVEVSEVCSGRGNCTGPSICTCRTDAYSRYFGDECEVQFCYDIISNDTTNQVCGGRGECVDFDKCICDDHYDYFEDCSMWKCFGVWKNDTSIVCNGEKNDKMISRGECTAHDTCECEEGYQSSDSCDFDCFGEVSWVDDSCGEYGKIYIYLILIFFFFKIQKRKLYRP